MGETEIREVKILEYERPAIEKGYANQTLHVNLSDSEISIKPVTEKMKEVFVGGKGFDLWLLWNAVRNTTKWNDPENEVCIASGPLGGTPVYPGSGKSIVTSLSPLTGAVMDSNVGGYFGPYLKFSGFDALEVQGKAPRDVVILIDGVDQKVRILEIPGLADDAYTISARLTEHFAQGKPRSVSVVSTGAGAKNTLIGCLNFTWYDPGRTRPS
jgi:aldehyde:ferredoxin oxidoreductase